MTGALASPPIVAKGFSQDQLKKLAREVDAPQAAQTHTGGAHPGSDGLANTIENSREDRPAMSIAPGGGPQGKGSNGGSDPGAEPRPPQDLMIPVSEMPGETCHLLPPLRIVRRRPIPRQSIRLQPGAGSDIR
jgi:hypothetical protein